MIAGSREVPIYGHRSQPKASGESADFSRTVVHDILTHEDDQGITYGPYVYCPNRQPRHTDRLYQGPQARVLFYHQELQGQAQEMVQQRTIGGRPLIIVSEDYEGLPTINLVIHNVGPGPAKNITFDFSAPSKARTSTCSPMIRPSCRRG